MLPVICERLTIWLMFLSKRANLLYNLMRDLFHKLATCENACVRAYLRKERQGQIHDEDVTFLV